VSKHENAAAKACNESVVKLEARIRELEAEAARFKSELAAAYGRATGDAKLREEIAELNHVIERERHTHHETAKKLHKLQAKRVLTRGQFNKLRACLHPDRRNSASDKTLAWAFDTLSRLEEFVVRTKDAS
jgi:hypothetical protein